MIINSSWGKSHKYFKFELKDKHVNMSKYED